MKVLLNVALDTVSGYGNDGVGIVRALNHLGVEVHVVPVAVVPPIPAEVAQTFVRAYEPPYDLTIVHLDPNQLVISDGVRALSKRVVGWTMWEFEEFTPESRFLIPEQMANFDLLLFYDEVSQKALAPLSMGVPHKVLQGGFWSEDWKFMERDWSGTFRFLMVGALNARKDPFAAIEAFAKLKAEHGDDFDAELTLKTNKPGLHPSIEEVYPGVNIRYQWWSQERLRQEYARTHCLLAPSRGEGKNVPALEAQSTGIPVIATNYGGHRQWMREEFAYPLGFRREVDEMGTSARADRDELARLMWHVYTHRDEARRKGELASRTIPAAADWVTVMRRCLDMVKTIPERELGYAL